MRCYEWYSDLPPERVRARLMVRARLSKSAWDQYDERQALVRFLPDGRFQLWKTGGIWAMRPQFPFTGTITPAGDGSTIAGAFQSPKALYVPFAVMGAVALLAALAFGVPFLVVVIFVGAWLALSYGLANAVGFNNPQNRETLAFIESELLRE